MHKAIGMSPSRLNSNICDQAEHLLRFLDKYVSHAIGSHLFLQWSKSNRAKTFLDRYAFSMSLFFCSLNHPYSVSHIAMGAPHKRDVLLFVNVGNENVTFYCKLGTW
jgi:hypothetical protein